MKRIVLLISCVVVSGMQAINLREGASCSKLKAAIEQGQDLAQFQRTLAEVIKREALSSSEQQALDRQALTYAQEVKKMFHAHLDNKSYDISELKLATVQLAGIVYCLGSMPLVIWIINNTGFKSLPRFIGIPISVVFIPLIGPVIAVTKDDTARKVASTIEYFLRACFTIYFITKGAQHLYQAFNPRELIEQKIKNLDATIAYLQEQGAGSVSITV